MDEQQLYNRIISAFERFVQCARELNNLNIEMKEYYASPKKPKHIIGLDEAIKIAFSPQGASQNFENWFILYHNQYKVLASEFANIARFLPKLAYIKIGGYHVYFNGEAGFYWGNDENRIHSSDVTRLDSIFREGIDDED